VFVNVEYASNRKISVEQFVELLAKTTLGGWRPLENRECMVAMLEHADILVTAWVGDRLVGLARSVTDFQFCCYMSELAVSDECQSMGIGKELVRQTFTCLKEGCFLTLLSAPQAVDFYPKIGFERHESSWVMTNVERLR
jgi:ribosomal protein S18 acetylase RimI-like enzyme